MYFVYGGKIHRKDVSSLGLDFPFGKIPSRFSRKIRQHYYAATTYIDSLVGEVLQALSQTGHGEDTIVTLLSDHGWSLGLFKFVINCCDQPNFIGFDRSKLIIGRMLSALRYFYKL